MNNILSNLSFLKNKLILFPIIFIAIVIVVLISWVWLNQISGTISLTIAPQDSKITLNNTIYSNGDHHVWPGKYTLKIEKEGFETKTLDINIKSKETKKIILALNQINGDSWYKDHKKDDIIRSGAGYQAISDKMNILKNNSPIVSNLPYKDNLKNRFTIDYETNSDTTRVEKIKISINTCLNHNSKLDTIEFRKQSALNWLNSHLKSSEQNKYKIEVINLNCIL